MENNYFKAYAELTVENIYGTKPNIGETYNKTIDGKEVTFELIDKFNSKSGYGGYAYKNRANGEIIIVHEGSQNPISTHPGEVFKDWVIADGNAFMEKISEQFYDANNFVNRVRQNNPTATSIQQIGQSLGGTLAQMIGALAGNENINTYTFNAYGAGNLIPALIKEGFTVSASHSNIINLTYGNEVVSTFNPHIGELYSSGIISKHGIDSTHNVQAHIQDGLEYHKVGDMTYLSSVIAVGYSITIDFNPETGCFMYTINTPLGTLMNGMLEDLLNSLSTGGFVNNSGLKGYVSMDGELYEIKPGDTIYGICDKYNVDLEELLKLNSWLRDRFSDDMTFALIRPGERIRLPLSCSGLLDKRPTFDIPFDEAAGSGTPGADPLLVDLNGDGVIGTTSVDNGAHFDHRVDGFAEKSAWVSDEDGVLVIDKNENGIIDNGSEIFGNNYIKNSGSLAKNGFDALKDLDSNNDGVISAEDAEFNNIKILKGNGELISLEEAGITSINLSSTTKNTVDENGNTLVSQGTFVRNDGSIGSLGDFNLVVDNMNSFATEWLDESEEISILPDIRGFGYVHTLHQAMVRDEEGSLKGLVEEFIEAESETAKKEILGQILYKWTGADKVTVASGGVHYNGQKLYVIEQFVGEEFKGINNNGQPNIWAAGLLDDAYNQIAEYVYYALMIQTDERIKNIYNMIELEYSLEDNKVLYNFDKVIEYIDNGLAEDETTGINKLLETTQMIKALGIDKQEGYEKYIEHFNSLKEEYGEIIDAINKHAINGTDEDDNIEGTAGADAVFAGEGNDTVYTRQGDDIVHGGEGNDSIDACEGNDTIYGEGGDDTILGGNGNDLIYGGDGNDSINAGNGVDTIYGEDGDDRINTGYNGGMAYGGNGNDTIYGAQGANTIYGGSGNDSITTGYGFHKIYGEEGDDYIEATNGGSYIDGGEGNDTIMVKADGANNTIIGGKGDDYIENIRGNYSIGTIDSYYIYNVGDGHDTLTSSGRNNTLEFGEGITKENIRFQGISDNSILITFNNIEGSIKLVSQLSSNGGRIEVFKFADGSSYSNTQILKLLTTEGTEGNDSLGGSIMAEKMYGYDGNDSIYGNNGDDTIYGGEGDDSINGGAGNDILYGGNGNDTIINSYGNDYIDAGDGNDSIAINSTSTNLTIAGGLGNDYIDVKNAPTSALYIYNLGDGDDTIKTSSKNDVIEFGEGITKENIRFGGNDSYNMLITFKDAAGSILITNGLGNNNSKIEIFRFADGTEYSYNDAMSMLETIGTEGNDKITGSYSNEKIYGYGGNDTIDGGRGWDSIYGGDGDDKITTNNGSTYLDGENGNDTIIIDTPHGTQTVVGGKGDDYIEVKNSKASPIYKYNLGDGNDTINTSSKNDVIEFGEGISLENICFSGIDTYDILITFKDSEGSIRIKDAIGSSYKNIENIKFADGTILDNDQIIELLTINGTEENDSITGSYASEKIYGYSGDDTINGNRGNDTIYGGNGNDSILGDAGNDILYGEDGNDKIMPGEGNNTVYGGNGNDTIRLEVRNNSGAANYLNGEEGDDYFYIDHSGKDTIIGGTGDDSIWVNYSGDNTYIYNLGDGNDTIYDYQGNDVLEFGEGITKDNILIWRDSNDVTIEFKGQEGSIQIIRYWSTGYNRIETFKFSDGTTLTTDEIIQEAKIKPTEDASQALLFIPEIETLNDLRSEQTVSNSDINKIIQDMTAYNTAEDALVSYSNNIDQEKELITLVNSSM